MRPGVSSGYKLFDTQTTFSPTLSNTEALSKLQQMRNLADDNLISRLRVKPFQSGFSSISIFVQFYTGWSQEPGPSALNSKKKLIG